MFKLDRGINKLFSGKGFGVSLDGVPTPLRRGVYNVFSNLDEPVSAVNQVLQGKFKHAAVSTGRFVTNSTVGLLGTRDVATGMGMRKHHEDFGQTLAKYGVPAGPYIFLPLLGPSTVRDKLAGRVDSFARPLSWVDSGDVGGSAIGSVRTAMAPSAVSIRQRARAAKDAGATDDEYATLRDLYYAKRAAQIEDAAGADEVPEPYWRQRGADVQYARGPQAGPRYAAPQARYAEAPQYAVASPTRDRRAPHTVNSVQMAASQAAYDANGEAWGDIAYVGSDDDWAGDAD
jgi:phospholipid-binding lipoprotein MlaA